MTSLDVPRGWSAVTLGDLAAPIPNAIADGPFGSNLKTSDYVESGVPVLQGKNITADTFRWTDVRYISERKAQELRRSFVRVGDVLVVKIGSVGYSAIVRGLQGFDVAVIPANMAKVTPNHLTVDVDYLHRWLTSPQAKNYLVGAASKTAQPALSLGKIKALPVPLPPLPEQRRIAAILDQADALRAKRRDSMALLDTLAQSIFLDMFGSPVLNERGWPTTTVADMCDLVRGSSPRPQGDGRYFGGPIPRLMVADITRDGWHVTPRIDSLTLEGAKRSRPVPAGTVVMAVSGNVGLASLLTVDACIHDGFVGFTELQTSIIEPEFLLALLRLLQSTGYERAKAGAIFINLTTADIKAMRVPLPPLHLQQRFVCAVGRAMHLKCRHTDSLAGLDELFASLQHRAFRGEL